MANHEMESRGISFVLAHERAADRTATDARHFLGSVVDVESVDDEAGEMRLIEGKAFGGSGRGDFLWLETSQVEALGQVPGSHLYRATSVCSVAATIASNSVFGMQMA